jgi:DUF2971 family protein
LIIISALVSSQVSVQKLTRTWGTKPKPIVFALIYPMGKLASDFLSTPIPPEVWHYTNLAGFEGILSSGRIWATEAHHTTDKTEFVHARDVATQYLQRFQPKNDGMTGAKQTAQEIVDRAFDQGVLSPSKIEIFIASFCATDDLKSQWTKYADSGCGISLSFDLRHVRPPVEIGCLVTFAPCLYTMDEKERVLADALSDWVNTFAELYEKTGSKEWAAEQLRKWQMLNHGLPFDRVAWLANNQKEFHVLLQEALTRASADLLRIASHCKHHTFYQEAEWRLALPHEKGKPMKYAKVLHRSPNHSTPYIAHNLFSEKLPLVRVKAGPLCEKIDQIKALLGKYGYSVPVERSVIPIRSVGVPGSRPDFGR